MALLHEPRLPLSRDRILAAALELADERGLDAVTMRELGRALGFEAMSLYNYVASKDDLLDGILDLVLAECEAPATDGDWAESVRRSAISVHDALRGHPWAPGLLMGPTRVRTARLRYMDSLLGRLREAGFSADATYSAYHVLDGHIFGFAIWEASHTFTPEQAEDIAEAVASTITPEAFTHLHEHARQHMTDGPHREVSAFELGLDLILDGLEKLRAKST
jgi:AcrR family transcriptional regulator